MEQPVNTNQANTPQPPAEKTPGATFIAGRRPATELAIEDLAQRLGVPQTSISVLSVSSDDLPAQDLGCPAEKGGRITPAAPALVIGQIVRLQAGEQVYEYHIRGQRVAFCGQV